MVTVEPRPQATPLGCDLDGLREQLVLLAASCPHTKSNPWTCPLHALRQMEPSAIIDWIDALEDRDREYLMFYHQCCLVTQRERDLAARPKRGRNRPRSRGFGGMGCSPNGGPALLG